MKVWTDRCRKTQSRAFTLLEVVIVITVIVVALMLILSFRKGHRPHPMVKDATQLAQLHKAAIVFSRQFNGRLPTPSLIAGGTSAGDRDPSLDTTANLYSALIAQNYIGPELLISPGEVNPKVRAKTDYDFAAAWRPAAGVFWDQAFKVDLQKESNASYAHLVLHGDRFEEQWQDTLDPAFALFGTRGPKDGKPDPKSLTYKLLGSGNQWVGNICYSDGHVNLEKSFTAPGVTFLDDVGIARPDNFFAFDDGTGGGDIVLSFTRSLTADGPIVQHD